MRPAARSRFRITIARIVPAGPPAAVLLEAIAPDLMVGWPSPVSEDARALLSPDAAKLPQIPRLTGRADVSEEIKALKPDLILDYGTVSPRYADLAQATQQRTGIPTILLDGSLAKIPDVAANAGRHPASRGPRGNPGQVRRGAAGAASAPARIPGCCMRAGRTA